jgi:hypothetical protein
MTPELQAANGNEFWDLLSPERSLFPRPSEIIYRGQANAAWQLTPRLFRDPDVVRYSTLPFQLIEWMILDTFRKYCDSAGLRIPNDSLEFRSQHFDLNRTGRPLDFEPEWPPEGLTEFMALAQHYGLPTRLLDWTQRGHVAAYFAASGALALALDDPGNTPERFAVWSLNTTPIGQFRQLKILRVPGSNNANLAAQAGLFTLLRQKNKGLSYPLEGPTVLDEYVANDARPQLLKVTVSISEAPAVLEKCEKYFITGATLFPDYHGVVRASMDNWRRERWRLRQELSAPPA